MGLITKIVSKVTNHRKKLMKLTERDLDSLQVPESLRNSFLDKLHNLPPQTYDLCQSYSDTSTIASELSLIEELDGNHQALESFSRFPVPTTVKCYFNDDIRTFEIETTNLDTLRKKIEEEYNQQFILKYRDNENELVSLHSNEHLKAAVKTSPVLKLHLSPLKVINDTIYHMFCDLHFSVNKNSFCRSYSRLLLLTQKAIFFLQTLRLKTCLDIPDIN